MRLIDERSEVMSLVISSASREFWPLHFLTTLIHFTLHRL